MQLDLVLFNFVNNLANYKLIGWLAIFFAKYLAFFALALLVFIWLGEKQIAKRWNFAFLTLLSLVLSRGVVVPLIRSFYNRLRPEAVLKNINVLINHDRDFSFPSGHASFFFALALAIFYFDKKWGLVYFLIAILVVFSRIVVGVHWPTDILFGALIGLLSAFLVRKFLVKGH